MPKFWYSRAKIPVKKNYTLGYDFFFKVPEFWYGRAKIPVNSENKLVAIEFAPSNGKKFATSLNFRLLKLLLLLCLNFSRDYAYFRGFVYSGLLVDTYLLHT